MLRRHIALLLLCLAIFSGTAAAQQPGTAAVQQPATATAQLKVHDQVLHQIDVRLFGQFFERASFGDHGPEPFADPATGRLPDKIVDMLKDMQIPLVRFPGGTDVDYIDWRDMIDNVRGRDGPRPITRSARPGTDRVTTIGNRFGYDEYFALRDQLKCQTILVVNLADGLAKRRPLDEAAQLAAGLVAYANAPQGAKLPDAMPNWPAIRAANGHAKPFAAEFVQIGNEIFLKTIRDEAIKATGLEKPEDLAVWYLQVYTAYIRAIRAVDADIQIIIDAYMGGSSISRFVQADPYIKANVAYLTFHSYAPGSCKTIRRGTDETLIDPSTLTDAQYWWAWAAMPGAVDEKGQSQAFGAALDPYRETGYRLAATEWNWNGWSWKGLTKTFQAPAAAGLGAAGFIQGLMRQGDRIDIATQSMMLGSSWSFASVFADPTGEKQPYYTPQGSATTFYRKHHGRQMLRHELSNVATHPQPFRFGWGTGVEHNVAELDVIVTANNDRIYIHAINRNFDRNLPLRIDLSDLGKPGPQATHHQLTFNPHARPDGLGVSDGVAQLLAKQLPIAQPLTVDLPARTISIIEIPILRN